MDFGLTMPTRGPMATRETIMTLASKAEELGFASLAVPDHIVVPQRIDSTYPYSDDGDWPGQAGGDCLDQFALLTFLAAITNTPKLISSVTVVPYRGAVETAKLVASIDVLSNGRMTFGVGAGWLQEEFEAVGAPDFSARGRVTNEYLEACKVLWTQDNPRYQGDFANFADISFAPKPVQRPHPPIWVGGESPAAMRRAVALGDAWYPIGNNPRHPLNTGPRFVAGVERLHALCDKANRDPATLAVPFFSNWFDESKAATTTDDGGRMLLTGSVHDLVDDIGALGAAGVDHLVLNLQRATLSQSLDSMQYFAEEIRSRI